MPTYEYACRDCAEHLEVVQSFKDDALTECPNCHGSLRKVFSAAGLIFKGSGWHVKDYANSPGSGSSSKETGSKESASKETSSNETSSTTSKKGSSSSDSGSGTTPATKKSA